MTSFSSISSSKILVFFIALITFFNLGLILKSHQDKASEDFLSQPSVFFDEDELDFIGNELNGCYHIFLDVGSNIGNTIRKLYEPHLFINASYLPIFNKYFGDSESVPTVCSVGFEPNPRHVKTLQEIQTAYQKCGWKTVFHTSTAAAHSYGLATFFSDNKVAYNEWGGSIVQSRKAKHPSGFAK